MSGAHDVMDLRFSQAQWAFWTATDRYVDFEGAVRAGKTTPAILKVIDSCQAHPGIQWLIARWTQDATDAQLKARFRELCSPDILVGWNAQEQYFEIAHRGRPDEPHLRPRPQGRRGRGAVREVRRADAGRRLRGPAGGDPRRLLHGAEGAAVAAGLSAPDAADAEPAAPRPLAGQGVPRGQLPARTTGTSAPPSTTTGPALGRGVHPGARGRLPRRHVCCAAGSSRGCAGCRWSATRSTAATSSASCTPVRVDMHPAGAAARGLGLRPRASVRGVGAVPPAGRPACPGRGHGRVRCSSRTSAPSRCSIAPSGSRVRWRSRAPATRPASRSPARRGHVRHRCAEEARRAGCSTLPTREPGRPAGRGHPEHRRLHAPPDATGAGLRGGAALRGRDRRGDVDAECPRGWLRGRLRLGRRARPGTSTRTRAGR